MDEDNDIFDLFLEMMESKYERIVAVNREFKGEMD